jgi:hypothetical protein
VVLLCSSSSGTFSRASINSPENTRERKIMLSRVMKIGFVFGFALQLAGCSFTVPINYSGASNLAVTSKIPAGTLVIVQDRRPYILDDSYSLTYTGISRSLYGIPYARHTASDKPLADDLGTLIVNSLTQSGHTVLQTIVTPTDSPLAKLGAGKVGLLFTLRDWKTDTYLGTSFNYNVELAVLKDSGATARVSRQASQALGNSEGDEDPTLSEAIVNVLGSLLNDPAVASALASSSASLQ